MAKASLDERLFARDSQAAKVHIGPDGAVWLADCAYTPVRLVISLVDFAERLRRRPQPLVRMLGTAANADAILLLDTACRLCGGKLELASPAICWEAAELRRPEVALYRMRQVSLPGSLGGWHECSAVDLATYGLLSFSQQQCGGVAACRAVQVHPVWSYIGFIPHLAPAPLAALLCEIIDPRWHLDVAHPDRAGRLRMFLGLTPEIQSQLSRGVAPSSPRMRRCQLVMRTWKTSVEVPADPAAPGYFLWRIRQKAGGGAAGDLRASQKFVLFLHYAWLAAIQGAGIAGSLFLPEGLLKTEAELAYYEQFRQQHGG